MRVAPNLQRFQARVQARKEAERQKQARGAKPLAEALVKKQEERAALADAANRRHKHRIATAEAEHRSFRLLRKALASELAMTRIVEPGVVDLDLGHLIEALKVHTLPREARFLALQEVQEFIRQVHFKRTRSRDITNYERLFDPKFVDSLEESKSALRIH